MVDSARKSTRVLIGSSSTSVGWEEISPCSATTSDPRSFTSSCGYRLSITSVSTKASGSGSTPFAIMFPRIFPTPAKISLHSATRSLNCGLSNSGSYSTLGSLQFASDAWRGVEHTEYEEIHVRQTNIDRIYDCLFTTNKLLQPTSFEHNDTSA